MLSPLPFPLPGRRRFRPATGYFCQAGRLFESRAPLSTDPLPFITGGAAAIRRACVTENTRPPEIYFIPALALDGLASRHGTGRGSRPGNNGEREKRSGFSGNPEMILRNPLRHAYIPSKRAILVHLAETARLLLSNEFLDLCFSVLAIYRARVWCSLTGGSRPLERRGCTIWKRGKKGNGEKMKWRTTRRLDAKYPFYVPFMIHEQRIYLCIYRMLKCR